MAMTGRKGYEAKRRNSGERKRRSIILIAAEGRNKTETQYFKDFAKDRKKNVRFAHGNDTDPVHMMTALRDSFHELELDSELGDQAFCLVDADVNPEKNSQLAKADAISKKEGLNLIVSAPCFEVWCLCHFGSNSKHYSSSNAVVDELAEKLHAYRKSAEGLYEILSPDTEKAVGNAKTLEKVCLNAGYTPHTVEFSPSSEVYKVVELLLKNED